MKIGQRVEYRTFDGHVMLGRVIDDDGIGGVRIEFDGIWKGEKFWFYKNTSFYRNLRFVKGCIMR